jgi:hypothetical protein
MQVTIEVLLKGRFKWWKRHQIKNWFMNRESYAIYIENKKTKVTRTGDILLMFTVIESSRLDDGQEGRKVMLLYKLILREHFDKCIHKMLFTAKPDEQKKEEG